MTLERFENCFDTNIHVKIFVFINDKMSGCLNDKFGTESNDIWQHETGNCLIEGHVHVKSVRGQ